MSNGPLLFTCKIEIQVLYLNFIRITPKVFNGKCLQTATIYLSTLKKDRRSIKEYKIYKCLSFFFFIRAVIYRFYLSHIIYTYNVFCILGTYYVTIIRSYYDSHTSIFVSLNSQNRIALAGFLTFSLLFPLKVSQK